MADLEKLINKTRSGKNHKDENFPVGSFFIKRKLRPLVKAYYTFARTADDVADSKNISKEEKLNILTAMADSLERNDDSQPIDCVINLVNLMDEYVLNKANAYDLLTAFVWDAQGREYNHWEDLLNYCRYSAAPVGRFMLNLHKEPAILYPASDALCSALQILNHIQDIRGDIINLDRIYMPKEFMVKFGVTLEDLCAKKTNDNLRDLIDKMLHNTLGLLEEGKKIFPLIKNKSLKTEVLVIFNLAILLLKKLQTRDPLKNKIKLYSLDWLKAGLFAWFNRPML